MSSPLVSIIITTFAGSKTLNRAIASVLNQDYKNWELIVVDDNNPTSDERKATQKLMDSYVEDCRVIYIKHEKNKNGSVARNTGISHSNGIYISFLDDDDVYFPERLSCCVEELERHPELDAVLTNVIVTDGNYIIDNIIQDNHTDPVRDMFFGNPLGTGSNLFMTKNSVKALSGFDVTFLRRQDVEFMLRFFSRFRCAYLKRNLVAKIVERKNVKVKIDYNKFKSVEEHFIDKFHGVIYEYLTDQDRKAYLDHTYTILFRMALVSSAYDTRSAVKDLERIRPLSNKERMLVIFNRIYRSFRNNKILYEIKVKLEQKQRMKRIQSVIDNISKEDKSILLAVKAIV